MLPKNTKCFAPHLIANFDNECKSNHYQPSNGKVHFPFSSFPTAEEERAELEREQQESAPQQVLMILMCIHFIYSPFFCYFLFYFV